MESVIAEIIRCLTETYELLPLHHYGGRPGRSAEDVMMILSESIYQAWKKKKIYTAVFMDVAGAFNNVHYERLIHNLRKHCIPHAIQVWTTSVRSRSGPVQSIGPTFFEMESDRTDWRMNLDRTDLRPIQKQPRPTDRSESLFDDWTGPIGRTDLGPKPDVA